MEVDSPATGDEEDGDNGNGLHLRLLSIGTQPKSPEVNRKELKKGEMGQIPNFCR
uniref:OSJNBb0089K06.9 protein n=1 Tax=Oryza sativa subsp. japonica TaxID=39947 RepID=Q7XNZ7_ORYSJ|nr:OSJNBb0089K06.9 [Oryza sativa Japonica Group]